MSRYVRRNQLQEKREEKLKRFVRLCLLPYPANHCRVLVPNSCGGVGLVPNLSVRGFSINFPMKILLERTQYCVSNECFLTLIWIVIGLAQDSNDIEHKWSIQLVMWKMIRTKNFIRNSILPGWFFSTEFYGWWGRWVMLVRLTFASFWKLVCQEKSPPGNKIGKA